MKIDLTDITIPSVSEIEKLLLHEPVILPNEDVIYESWIRVQKRIKLLKGLSEENYEYRNR